MVVFCECVERLKCLFGVLAVDLLHSHSQTPIQQLKTTRRSILTSSTGRATGRSPSRTILTVRRYPQAQVPIYANAIHFISRSSSLASPNKSQIRRRSAIASRVNRPCLHAFRFSFGAPDPFAPPCI